MFKCVETSEEMSELDTFNFVLENFPEYVEKVINVKFKSPYDRTKAALELFLNDYNVVYWGYSYTEPDDSIYQEETENEEDKVINSISDFYFIDSDLVVKEIINNSGLSDKEAEQLYMYAPTFFVNEYYGDSITFSYVVIKKTV